MSAIVDSPLALAHSRARMMFGRPTRRRDGDQHVPGAGLRLQLVLEHRVVPEIVGDGAEQLDVGAQALHARQEAGTDPHALDVVALEVVGDRGRAAVAAREHGVAVVVRGVDDLGCPVQLRRVDGVQCPGQLLGVVAPEGIGRLVPGARELGPPRKRHRVVRRGSPRPRAPGRAPRRCRAGGPAHRRGSDARRRRVPAPRPCRRHPRPRTRGGRGRGLLRRPAPCLEPVCGPGWLV